MGWVCYLDLKIDEVLRHSQQLSQGFCGRGGTGRRAALRSLWALARGSSSLLDRTNLMRSAWPAVP